MKTDNKHDTKTSNNGKLEFIIRAFVIPGAIVYDYHQWAKIPYNPVFEGRSKLGVYTEAIALEIGAKAATTASISIIYYGLTSLIQSFS